MLAQLGAGVAEFLSNFGDITPNPLNQFDPAQNARLAGVPGLYV
jgi:hypothetical protein